MARLVRQDRLDTSVTSTVVNTRPARPIWILTLPRSGSTLLRHYLDAHSEILCLPETDISTASMAVYRSWLDYEHHAPISERRRIAIHEVHAFVDRLIRWHLSASGKRLFCDKSLPNLEHAALLARAFRRAKFICLYRNPMDFIASALEASRFGFKAYGLAPYVHGHSEDFVFGLSRLWCERTAMIMEFQKKNRNRCIPVFYESLVTNPQKVMADVFDFLEVRDEDQVYSEALNSPHLRGRGDFKVLLSDSVSTESLGRGSAVPIDRLPSTGLTNMNGLLAELGYEPLDAEWNLRPSEFRRGLASARDYESVKTILRDRVFPRLQQLTASSTADVTVGSIRIVFEEFERPPYVCIDLEQRVLELDDGSRKCDSILVWRSSSFVAVSEGWLTPQDALARGEIRWGNSSGPQNIAGLKWVVALIRPE
jgi:protein-tyrosine sulfotransferase